MKLRYLLMFGYAVFFVCSLWLVFLLQEVTGKLVGMHFGLPVGENGWSHEESLHGLLIGVGPSIVALLIHMVVLFFLCRKWKKSCDDALLAKNSIIQLIFGLVMLGSFDLGMTLNAVLSVKYYLIGRYEVISEGKTWIDKKEVLASHDKEMFQKKHKANTAEHAIYFVYYLVGFGASLGVIRSARKRRED